MFGRWELPAYVQEVTRLARDLRDGRPSDTTAHNPAVRQPRPSRRRNDDPCRCIGVVLQPRESYVAGDDVEAAFAVTGDGGPLLPSYVLVESRDGDGWTSVAADGDGTTTVEWKQVDKRTNAHAKWRVPARMSGAFRLSYADVDKHTSTREFTVTS